MLIPVNEPHRSPKRHNSHSISHGIFEGTWVFFTQSGPHKSVRFQGCEADIADPSPCCRMGYEVAVPCSEIVTPSHQVQGLVSTEIPTVVTYSLLLVSGDNDINGPVLLPDQVLKTPTSLRCGVPFLDSIRYTFARELDLFCESCLFICIDYDRMPVIHFRCIPTSQQRRARKCQVGASYNEALARAS